MIILNHGRGDFRHKTTDNSEVESFNLLDGMGVNINARDVGPRCHIQADLRLPLVKF